jgi:hypothetical protein
MTFRSTLLLLAGCAAALVVSSTFAEAQDTTRTGMRDSTGRLRDTTKRVATQRAATQRATSEQRVRVQKNSMNGESNGTIDLRADSLAAAARARADSMDRVMQRQRDSMVQHERDSIEAVNRARADSVARVETMRRDSIAAAAAALEAARRDSVARADSILAAEQLRQQQERNRYRFHGSGWYVGVSGGGALPNGDFENLGYQSGYDVNVPIGWHRPGNLLGLRLDLGFSAFDGRSFVGNGPGGSSVTLTNGSPKVYSATLNTTLRIPLGTQRFNLYGVGGAGLYHFRSFGGTSALGGFLGNDVLETNEAQLKQTRNKIGAQVGGGIDFGVGPASIFIESRLVNVWADRDDSVQFRDFFGDNASRSLRWVPIVLGVNIR